MGGMLPIDPNEAYLIQATLMDGGNILGYVRKPHPSTSPHNSWRSIDEGDFTFFSKPEAERYILTIERQPHVALSIVSASSVLGEPGDDKTYNSDDTRSNDGHAQAPRDLFPEPPENRPSDWLQKELQSTDPAKIALALEQSRMSAPKSEKCGTVESVQALIAETCDEIRGMLLSKNKAYGNSALDPMRVFSKCSAREQILVRIDDKLSRIQRGGSLGEDTVKDLIGYLVLLRVAEKTEIK